jgi:hypothetical protein
MAEISKIKVNNATYNVKDNEARTNIEKKLVLLTEDEYNALSSKDSGVLYCIYES